MSSVTCVVSLGHELGCGVAGVGSNEGCDPEAQTSGKHRRVGTHAVL